MTKSDRNGARLMPWSFSRLKDYERCPFYAWYSHVLKIKGPQSPYAARGETIHAQAEKFVKQGAAGKRQAMPKSLNKYSVEFREVSRASAMPQTELKFGVTYDWRPTAFFGGDVWGRGVWDLAVLTPERLLVVDYKTGKMYPETIDQLRFYACAAFAVVGFAPRVNAEAWHLDQPYPMGKQTFELLPSDVRVVRKTFNARIKKMMGDNVMQPRPNAYCRYCHLRRSAGGPCPEDQ